LVAPSALTDAGKTFSDISNLNARRLQIPFFTGYNKDSAYPVTPAREWIHLSTEAHPEVGADIKAANGGKVYLEYMLELAWVQGTALAKASTTSAPNSSSQYDAVQAGTPGLAYAIAQESLKSLDKPFIAAKSDDTSKTVAQLVKETKKIVPKTTVKTFAVAKKKATVTFTKVAGATKYQIRYKVKGAKKWTTKSFNAKSTKVTLKKLTSGQTYQYQIRYTKKIGTKSATSKWSKTATSKKIK
jgi:hypothetical protein